MESDLDIQALCKPGFPSSQDQILEERRFHLLDGMRGIAAIIVVIGHMPKIWIIENFSHFYLAVDLFFMLSGFVIAFAYERRLQFGMSVGQFMLTRYIRLYPLYMAGTSIGILSAVITYTIGKGEQSFSGLAIAIPTAVLMLPSLSWNEAADLMPLNGPAWSLLFELAMNLCYASVLFRLATKNIALIVAVSALALIWTDLHLHSLHTGMTWSTIPFGIARVVFPYTIGILLYRVSSDVQAVTSWAYALPFGLLFIFMGHRLRPEITELLAVMIAFPLIVAAGIKFDVPNPAIFKFFGITSYAVYVISVPVITSISRVLHTFHVDETRLWPWFGYIVILGIVALAAWLDSHFDKPARQLLKRPLFPARASLAKH